MGVEEVVVENDAHAHRPTITVTLKNEAFR